MGASHLFVWRRRRACACQGRGFELVATKQGLLQMTAAVLEVDAQDIHARAPGEEEGEEEGACLLDACTVQVSRYTTFAYLIDLTVSPMHSVILYDYSLTVSPALTNTIACSNLYWSCLFNTDKYHCLFKDSTILDKCINPV